MKRSLRRFLAKWRGPTPFICPWCYNTVTVWRDLLPVVRGAYVDRCWCDACGLVGFKDSDGEWIVPMGRSNG